MVKAPTPWVAKSTASLKRRDDRMPSIPIRSQLEFGRFWSQEGHSSTGYDDTASGA